MRNDRRGFALPAAIGALVIIGILVTGGFFMAQQELRIGVASKHANMAVNIAQAGLNEVMGDWNGYQLGNIGVWADTTITASMAGGTWEVSISNANNFIYFLTAKGTVTEGGTRWAGATRTIGLVTKMIFANIDPPAALTTTGKVVVKGTAAINGTNTTPPSWAPYCSGVPTNDTTGVLVDSAGSVSTVGGGQVQGNPPSIQDPSVVDSTFNNFGNMNWAQLTALAQAEGKDITSLGTTISAVGPDTTITGRCNEANLYNWGDTLPSAACGAYFPLIYHAGPSLRLQGGGMGQGILLVDGALDLRGNFLFYGVIIIQGDFSTQGNGNRIIGAVMAANGNVSVESITGGSEITYSRCTVQRAILNNASLSRARPLAQRSWVDLTAVIN
ncbi:MAG: hypothetical protein O2958_08700 [Gemmatimonadetes bacterium]|nr:hypothetical protein [Gemmatimonadota bacterium]MDA1103765.1 hypothetical protein [Gemmatimonadota bacterium]